MLDCWHQHFVATDVKQASIGCCQLITSSRCEGSIEKYAKFLETAAVSTCSVAFQSLSCSLVMTLEICSQGKWIIKFLLERPNLKWWWGYLAVHCLTTAQIPDKWPVEDDVQVLVYCPPYYFHVTALFRFKIVKEMYKKKWDRNLFPISQPQKMTGIGGAQHVHCRCDHMLAKTSTTER